MPVALVRQMVTAASDWYDTSITSQNYSIWQTWNSASTGATLVNAANTWITWNNNVTIGATQSTGDTINFYASWQTWNDEVSLSIYNRNITAPFQQTAADRERQRLWEVTHRETEKMRAAARERAKQLLLEHLSNEQRAEYQKHNYFTVISKTSRRRYRVVHGFAGNVYLLDDKGQPIKGRKYCCHPTGEAQVPTEDAMLAQKLMLEYDEEGFLKLANVS